MKEIHAFYSRQHIPHMDRMFDALEYWMNRLDLGDFLKFCKDFSIGKEYKLKSQKLMELFKKASSCH